MLCRSKFRLLVRSLFSDFKTTARFKRNSDGSSSHDSATSCIVKLLRLSPTQKSVGQLCLLCFLEIVAPNISGIKTLSPRYQSSRSLIKHGMELQNTFCPKNVAIGQLLEFESQSPQKLQQRHSTKEILAISADSSNPG